MDSGKSMKRENSIFSNSIELDKEKVKDAITARGNYQEKGVKIKPWEGEKDTDFYIGTLEKNKSSYMGVLNVKLKRHNYGINKYENGDVYFGYFDNDVKAKHGAYIYSPKIEDGIINSEIYWGSWRENLKDHHGIYIWMTQQEGNTKFANADFDAYVGKIELDNYKKGCYLTKVKEDFYVYYGNFDNEGRKNDDTGLFYDNSKDRVFIGKIVNDKFKNGYLIYYNTEGHFQNIIYAEFDEYDTPVKIVKNEEIDLQIKTKIIKESLTFKDTLLNEDYFGLIYEKISELTDFVKNKVVNVNIFDTDEGYPKIMKVSSAYNDIKVFAKLEREFQ